MHVTDAGECIKSSAFAAWSVAPVVVTSSIKRIRLPWMRGIPLYGTSNTSAILSNRFSLDSVVWGTVFFVRCNAEGVYVIDDGMFVPLSTSSTWLYPRFRFRCGDRGTGISVRALALKVERYEVSTADNNFLACD